MRQYAVAGFLVLLSGVAAGQSTEPLPAFQVADIHGSARTTTPYMRGGIMRGGRFEVRTATLLDLIALAHNVESSRIAGGPNWLNIDRFDILAGAPPTTSQDTAKLMLQSLLAERFELVLHKDTKPLPVFVLSVGKSKPKMKAADGGSPAGCQGQPQPAPQPGATTYSVVNCSNMTMAAFAENLRGMAGAYLINPVVDETAITGAWDIELKWTPRALLTAAGSDGITIFDAIDKQLGLKLEPQSRPLPVVVVDSVNRNPTPNAPDIVTKLPPPPATEFEVAIVKLSAPDSPSRARIQGGRVDAEGVPLLTLIQFAWDVTEQMVSGLPKFAESNRLSITAKAPIPEGATSEQDVDDVTLRLMLRNLLIERFKMKTHMEDKLVEGYVLSAPKPKLEKADPSNRTECKEGPGKDGKDPRNTNPIWNRLITCTNMTMAQLAEQFPVLAGGYVRTAVLDSTGLEGAYDFTLNFSAIGLLQQNTNAPGQAGAPTDPNGALSLPDAINKQLGLKLELQKRMMPVLVIDHVEENPTEN